jgi:hypothetical protein
MRSIVKLLLLIFPTALILADTHGVASGVNVDLSAFKTFVVHEGYPALRPANKEPHKTPDVDSKLNQAVHNAIRAALTSKGIKETLDSPDLLVSYRVEVATQPKEVTGIVVIDLTNATSGTTIWHGQHIDDESSLAKLEKRLPDAIRKMLSDNSSKKN